MSDLSDFIGFARYAQYLSEKKRREVWEEQISRVMGMHETFFADKLKSNPLLQNELDKVRRAMLEKRVLGSQRALQFGGPAILNKHARMYNCTATYLDRPRSFQEVTWLLLCGCGVGVSVQQQHVDKLPGIGPRDGFAEFIIPDTIEGWADAVGVLLSSYFTSEQTFPEYAGKNVSFDFTEIRPKGSPISHMSGKAPGSRPLKKALGHIDDVIKRALKLGLKKLRPIDAFDIITHASDAVIAGGVRRSAILTMFSLEDDEMMKAKTGNWFVENAHRARSNNSVVLLRDEVTRAQFNSIIDSTRQMGEPGFIWTDDKDSLFNPCVEIGLYAKIKASEVVPAASDDMVSGSQGCNLSEINMKAVKSPDDFYAACEAASIVGTLQAAYTDFPYLGMVTEAIFRREALIGVSMTGMMDCPSIAFDPEVMQRGAAIVKAVNQRIAAMIGINPAARTTCVKPAGSTSCILGTASGIHPRHARKYFRRVQANVMEQPLQHYEMINPAAVEKSVWNPNGTDKVITFMCEASKEAWVKSNVSATDLLGHVKSTQQNWVIPGRNDEQCVLKTLNHNVSNTITVEPDGWDSVAQFIYDNRQYFAGVSCLQSSGDKDYDQAPFQAVHEPVELAKMYGDASVFASGLIIHAAKAFGGNLYNACACFLGVGEKLELPQLEGIDQLEGSIDNLESTLQKYMWTKRAEKFTSRYFAADPSNVTDDDRRKMTYCLKDVDAWKKWCDLRRKHQYVDWSLFEEEEDTTKPEALAACAGGSCELKSL